MRSRKIADSHSLVRAGIGSSASALHAVDAGYQRLRIIASYSPRAVRCVLSNCLVLCSEEMPMILYLCPAQVSLPALLGKLNDKDRFSTTRRKFFGCAVLADISGFTKLTETLAQGMHPTQQQNKVGRVPRQDAACRSAVVLTECAPGSSIQTRAPPIQRLAATNWCQHACVYHQYDLFSSDRHHQALRRGCHCFRRYVIKEA